MLMQEMGRHIATAVAVCALAALACPVNAHVAPPEDPLEILVFGTENEMVQQAVKDAQKAVKLAGIDINIEGADILKIGSSYAVDDGETISGDVVIIGGALTVEGKIEGDAVVVGGSMYLASTAVVAGDAVVIGGILEREDGSIVGGKAVENPQEEINLEGVEGLEGEGLEVRIEGGTEGKEGGEGDLVSTNQDVYIARDQEIKGDVVATGGDITVDGTVDGDVVATSGDVNVGSSAHVMGDVVSVFGEVEVADGAVVDGDIVKIGMGGPEVIRKGKQAEKETQLEGLEEIAPTPPGKEEAGRTVRYRLTLSAPDAKDVRLTGSFIDWDPTGIRMTVDDKGTWSTYYDFPEGTNLYKFIVDGKAIPDPDVPDKMVDDGMGGYATQLVVIPKSSKAVPIRFSLVRPQAQDVRVRGSFDNWDEQGIKMEQDKEGTWSVTVPIEPGPIMYQFYIDGEWGPDPDVAEQVDNGRGELATPFTIKPARAQFTLQAGTKEEKKGTNFSPAIDYNRVDGFYLAAVGSNKSNIFPLPRFYLEGGHAWRRDRWLYTVEIEQPIMPPILVSVGGSFYDKTDTNDRELISDGENFLSSAFLKRDYRDYFDRRGATGFVALRPFKGHTVKVSYSSDDYRPLSTRAHTAIFNFRGDDEFPANPHNPAIPPDEVLHNQSNIYQIGADPVTGLQIVDKISLRSMEVMYEYDSRDNDKTPSSGLWARLSGEWAGRDFGGTYDYSRYWADVHFYQQISSRQKYAVRAKIGGMVVPDNAHCPNIPGPEFFFPKQFFVGGIGTMPGYDYKEFRGTDMILMNAEYFIAMKGGCGLLFFADGGDARGLGQATGDTFEAMKIKYDAGVGVRCETEGSHVFTIGVAKRLDDTDEPVLVTVRASRSF